MLFVAILDLVPDYVVIHLTDVLLNFFQPIPSPLTPTVLLDGIVPEESLVFKSANYPLCIAFSTVNGGTSKMIFKKGDNLRKDQLVTRFNCTLTFLWKIQF